MKVSGKVLSSEIRDDRMIAVIQLNGKLPKSGENITLKWGKQRTGGQNALYWTWLGWCYDNGAKDQGYGSIDELHECLKGRFLVKAEYHNGMKSYRIQSTTELDTLSFTEYFEKCQDALREFLGVDDGAFWRDYTDCYSNIGG